MRLMCVVLAAAAAAGCARGPQPFIEDHAHAHVAMLAGTIGSRPVGSPANLRARAYIVEQLKAAGFQVRVQEADARRHELGLTARVGNIIGVLAGERAEAVGLVSHYDSSPDAPGAADDALGVAISLEAARAFAERPGRRWSLFVIVTDGEEAGLMGAAALVNDREVMDRLRAYMNFEAIGSAGTPVLFETGPGNGWLVAPWAHAAPHARGGSYGIEIYRRLPNDTDFSILRTRDIPGLNFATVGDSYAYHTARDTPDRLSRRTVRDGGKNALAVLSALQDADITRRSGETPTFFDLAGVRGVRYGPFATWSSCTVALLVGLLAWLRLTADAVRENGALRWLLVFAWSWLGAAAAFGSMVGATWLLRAAREVYHPWYARPGRLFLLLVAVGITVGWAVVRLGQWLPRRAHATRHPSLTWTVALPAWIALAALAQWFAPAASFLWALPLLAAGVLLSPVPPRRDGVIRVMSLIVLVVAGVIWLRDTHDLLRFTVAVMGRFPFITPVIVYAALIAAAGVMIVPPFVAVIGSRRPLLRPWGMTSVLLLCTAIASAAAYMAPGYTYDQPLRRFVRALQEPGAPAATWEVASVEPGLDLRDTAPGGWMPVTTPPPDAGVPWGRYTYPFVFRTAGPPLGAPPADLTGFSVTPAGEGVQLTISVVPREPAIRVSFVLPAGIRPARSTLPGTMRLGRWTATFVAPPAEGIALRAIFTQSAAGVLPDTSIVISASGFPGGAGPQRLPDWLPQETAVWSSTTAWRLRAGDAPSIPPVPALR